MGWVSVSRQEKTQLKVRNSPLIPHHTTPHYITTPFPAFLPPPGAADGVKGSWRCGQCVCACVGVGVGVRVLCCGVVWCGGAIPPVSTTAAFTKDYDYDYDYDYSKPN